MSRHAWAVRATEATAAAGAASTATTAGAIREREVLRAMRRRSVGVVVILRVATAIAALPLYAGSHDGTLLKAEVGSGRRSAEAVGSIHLGDRR